jgi:hypothetical protein
MTFPDTIPGTASGAVAPVSDTAPADAPDGSLWVDTSAAPPVLRMLVAGEWLPAVAGAGASSPQANLMWRAVAMSGDPGGQCVALDADAPADATAIHIAANSKHGVAIAGFVRVLKAGDSVFIWDVGNTANSCRFVVTGAPVDYGTWLAIPAQANGAQGNEPGDWSDCYVALTFSG